MGGIMEMAHFTLDEAQQYLGQIIIAQTDVDMGRTWVMAQDRGLVIGVDGGYTVCGELGYCLAVQFWPERESTRPTVLFVDKHLLHEYFSLRTEEQAASEAASSHCLRRGSTLALRGWGIPPHP